MATTYPKRKGSTPCHGDQVDPILDPILELDLNSCFDEEEKQVASSGLQVVSLSPNIDNQEIDKDETQSLVLEFSSEIQPSSIFTMTAALKDSTIVLCKDEKREKTERMIEDVCKQQVIINARISEDPSNVRIELPAGELTAGEDYFLRLSPLLSSLDGGQLGCVDDFQFKINEATQPSTSSFPKTADGYYRIDYPSDVFFEWNIPTERENGEPLYPEEIGGYEIRYKRRGDSKHQVKIIEGGYSNQEEFFLEEGGEYIFEVAAFDKNGLYSNFVEIAPN